MRQLLFWVRSDQAEEVCTRAAGAGATHTLRVAATPGQGPPQELLYVHLPNDRFDAVLAALEPVEELRGAFDRDSIVLIEPPPQALPDQVTDVTSRGPLEILVEGLQSLGAWPPFLLYSAVAGAVVWAGLVSDTTFLLTAAMLIAPYAAPAMTTALATARGDARLLRRSVGRYVSGIATTAVVAALLTLTVGGRDPTPLMVRVADVGTTAILLPMAAGVAGALSFGRADRTGIVSGAGVGMLVALALAPQAGLLGIGLVLGEAHLVTSAAFVGAMQLVGINVAAGIVFHVMGVRRTIPRARDGSRLVGLATIAVTVVALAGLLGLQWATAPALTRETVTTRAQAIATAVLDETPGVIPVAAEARFPLSSHVPDELFVLQVEVLRTEESGDREDELAALVLERLRSEFPNADPRVAVDVVGAH